MEKEKESKTVSTERGTDAAAGRTAAPENSGAGDLQLMKRALELAARGRGTTSPNPMVGCVITDSEGAVVGEGWHEKAGQAHAEVRALEDLASRGKTGHTAYVTLEPCSHFGRTGPCCEALIRAGLKRVVVAMTDPNPLVAGRGVRRMEEAGIEVETGLCGSEAARLNEKFLTWITKRRPFISLKYAMTLDGKITTAARDSHFVTGPEAHRFSHGLRVEHDAILVGIGTILDDDSQLTARLAEGPNPLRIVLDSRGRIPLEAAVLKDDADTLLVTGEDVAPEKLAALERLPRVEVLRLPLEEGRIPLDRLMEELAERQVASVLVEGGSRVLGSFLDSGLADRVYAFIAPKLVGGEKALPAIGGRGIGRMADCAMVENPEFIPLGRDLLWTGRVVFNKKETVTEEKPSRNDSSGGEAAAEDGKERKDGPCLQD